MKKCSDFGAFALGDDMDYFTKRNILHFFFPNRCPVCREVIHSNEKFCEKCYSELNHYSGEFEIENSDSFTAPLVYDEKVNQAIFLLKDGICGNSDYALGELLAQKLKENGISKKTDIIIPVPMYSYDEKRRGYNQSVLIGKQLERIIGIKCDSKIVVKTRSTVEQKTLSKRERHENLKGVFRIDNPEKIKGKRVLIVDDICTTGSTLSEIADLLKENGAEEVHCAACCKTEKKE